MSRAPRRHVATARRLHRAVRRPYGLLEPRLRNNPQVPAAQLRIDRVGPYVRGHHKANPTASPKDLRMQPVREKSVHRSLMRIPAKMNARSGICERRFRGKPFTSRSEATKALGLAILLPF